MKIIKMLVNLAKRAHYAWAAREINPMHPDVPRIIRRRAALADEWKKLCRR